METWQTSLKHELIIFLWHGKNRIRKTGKCSQLPFILIGKIMCLFSLWNRKMYYFYYCYFHRDILETSLNAEFYLLLPSCIFISKRATHKYSVTFFLMCWKIWNVYFFKKKTTLLLPGLLISVLCTEIKSANLTTFECISGIQWLRFYFFLYWTAI